MLGDGTKCFGNALGQNSALSIDGRNHHALGAVVVFQKLSCDALDTALDALGVQNDGFALDGAGFQTHDAAISSIPSSWGRPDGSNSNKATASTWAV